MFDRVIQAVRGVATAAVAFAVLGVSTSSDAAVYRTRWDPVFNEDFSPAVGWSGSATIDVDNSCVQAGTTVDFTSAPCTGLAQLVGYSVSFFDINTNANIVSVFGSGPGLPDPTAVSFDSNGIANGMELNSPRIEFAILAGTFSSYGQPSAFDAELAFTITGDQVTLALFEQVIEGEPTPFVSGLCDDCKPDVRWTPEPGSLALMGLALASLAIVRRRRDVAAR